MKSSQPDLELKLKNLPTAPGVYIFKDAQKKIIYIGKAKNLRNRVRTYFQTTEHPDAKTSALVEHVRDFDLIETHNEIESLILEANLVHEHSPRYNILLKDDKHFPYIKVTVHEPFPRVLIVRRLEKDGARYFGPYTSAASMRRTVTFLVHLFKIRSCRLVIPHPKGKKYVACLDYHIGRCGGPCEGFQTQDVYQRGVNSLLLALAGKTRDLIDNLTLQMETASEELRFEEAKECRDQIDAIRATMVKQSVDVNQVTDQDVVAIARESSDAAAVVMQVRDGALIGRQEFLLNLSAEDANDAVLETFVTQYYNHQPNLPDEILLPGSIADEPLLESWLREVKGRAVRLLTPKIGDRARVMELAQKNARLVLDEWMIKKRSVAERTSKMVVGLKDDLGLAKSPRTMVCFDISNTGETDAVASCVYFDNGKPKKSEYRHFHIKGVKGQDDFKMMREVVGRYFFRLSEEKRPAPDLVVVDGGKGQLSSALAELESLGFADQAIISLAKRLEEVYLPQQIDPITIPKSSPGLMLLKRIRDEAHRFAVTFNRAVRTKRTIQSALDGISGVGPAKRDALLRTFGSVEQIRHQSPEELAKVKGITLKLAQTIVGELAKEQPAN